MPPLFHMSIDDLQINISGAPEKVVPFCRWMLQQIDRSEFIGQFAAAKANRQFPKARDLEAVRKRLSSPGADTDLHEPFDKAELDWKAY